jgi:hypothetical protein
VNQSRKCPGDPRLAYTVIQRLLNAYSSKEVSEMFGGIQADSVRVWLTNNVPKSRIPQVLQIGKEKGIIP